MTDLDAIDREYACDDALGAAYSPDRTEFAVWSPLADDVTLSIYRSDSAKQAEQQLSMTRNSSGVWHCAVNGDLDGRYYTYTYRFGDTATEAPDIYSKSAGANGQRSMIFSDTSASPDGWDSDSPVKLQSPADAVIYELHIRDFSMDENAGFSARGRFSALCEDGVKNSYGDSVGTDYLSSLGITHVHLLPVMQNASVDDLSPTFNWGYDPYLYNVPEGSYCTDPHDGASRVRELRTLVQKLHSKGIGVILDVVYNHTYTVESSPFTAAFPHYYYRHDEKGCSNGSGCGNELATERRMVSRFIRDSLCALARDYHIDGFRFDLMGLMDIGTLNSCAAALRSINPDIILYGEGWTGGISPLPEELRALKHHADRTDGVAMFSDDFRDGVKGSVFSDTDRGYINGLFTKERRELIKSALCGGVYHPDIDRPEWQCWAKTPLSSINYVEAHDNLTLNDKLILSMPKADAAERERVARLAMALVILAQGIPFLQMGQELMRSKPDGSGGYVHDSYNSPDSINCIKWDDVTKMRGNVDYLKGLISLRRAYPELRLTTAQQVQSIRFHDLSGAAFALHTGSLMLCIDPHRRSAAVDLDGKYDILADGTRAGTRSLGVVTKRTAVAPQSILVLRRREC